MSPRPIRRPIWSACWTQPWRTPVPTSMKYAGTPLSEQTKWPLRSASRALSCMMRSVRRATGLLARAIQHEVDHLNGVLFIDHVTDPSSIEDMRDTRR